MKDSDVVKTEDPEHPSTDHPQPTLTEGADYYVENGLYVFTASYLKRRGYCCGSGCRHCPYPKETDR